MQQSGIWWRVHWRISQNIWGNVQRTSQGSINRISLNQNRPQYIRGKCQHCWQGEPEPCQNQKESIYIRINNPTLNWKHWQIQPAMYMAQVLFTTPEIKFKKSTQHHPCHLQQKVLWKRTYSCKHDEAILCRWQKFVTRSKILCFWDVSRTYVLQYKNEDIYQIEHVDLGQSAIIFYMHNTSVWVNTQQRNVIISTVSIKCLPLRRNQLFTKNVLSLKQFLKIFLNKYYTLVGVFYACIQSNLLPANLHWLSWHLCVSWLLLVPFCFFSTVPYLQLMNMYITSNKLPTFTCLN